MSDSVIHWITTQVLPHEAMIRRWLGRVRVTRGDADDLIQEAYCRIAHSPNHEVIRCGRAYFFRVVRNLLLEQIRRSRVVHIETMADIDSLSIEDEQPDVERLLTGSRELDIVRRLIDELPPRCKAVFRSRRIEGLSQRQTAQKLGLSENVVEKEVAHGHREIVGRLIAMDQARAVRAVSSPAARRRRPVERPTPARVPSVAAAQVYITAAPSMI